MGKAIKIRRPRVDDRRLFDVVSGLYAIPSILIAHKLGLYELLGGRGLTAAEVASRLNLELRPTNALLACSAALGFLTTERRGFRLTPLGAAYLLKSSPTYWGPFLDFLTETRVAFSVDNLEKSLRSNSAQGPEGNEWIAMQTEQERFAKNFTRVMHSMSVAPALAWPSKIDLSRNSTFLDIGGGSAAHSIGAVLRWKRLRAMVFDIAPVCEVAAEYAQTYGLSERIATQAGDMWGDPFPPADVHFYSQIFHDWSPKKCRELAAKSFAALKPGGRLIVHEMLLNDSKTGPLGSAGVSMTMMAWTQGQQFTADELSAILRETGFRKVQVKRTFGYWGIATGVKL